MTTNSLPKRPKNLGEKCHDCKKMTARFNVQTNYGTVPMCLTCADGFAMGMAADVMDAKRDELLAEGKELFAALPQMLQDLFTSIGLTPESALMENSPADFKTNRTGNTYITTVHCTRSGEVATSDRCDNLTTAMQFPMDIMENNECEYCHPHAFAIINGLTHELDI